MITTLFLWAIMEVIGLAFIATNFVASQFGWDPDVLPFGLDGIVSTFIGYIHGLIEIMPLLDVPFNIFILGTIIMFLIWLYENVFKWLIERIH